MFAPSHHRPRADRSRTRPSSVFLAIALLAALFTSTATTIAPSPAAASDPWQDLTDRQQVINSYDAEFSRTSPPINWTGDRSSCSAGTTSQAYRNAIMDRVNWFRGFAGVPAGVTENATYSAKAQQSALMMSVSGKLSHSPTQSTFECFSNDGREASGSGNLYLGRSGPEAITGYMYDPGSNNTSVGHRNWILHPTTRQMGTGDLPSNGGWTSNTLWVFDNVFGSQPALRESEGFVAWPPRGFVPGPVVFPRWSFSLRGANFNNAQVSVQRVEGNNLTSISAPVVHRSATSGAPFSIIVWEPTGIDTNPAIDTTYRVTITGGTVNGQARTFSYDTTVIGEQPAILANVSVEQVDYTSYVDQAFRSFLDRAATPAEISLWDSRLNSGTPRHVFVDELANSDEWVANVIDQMYLDTLGRKADAGGQAFWIARIQSGMTVAQVAAAFYGSPEYVANEGGSYEAWLLDLYAELLLRTPDNSGRAFWLSEVERRGAGSVAYDFYQSDESRRTRVKALFVELLGRQPDAGGLDFWADVLLREDDLALAANLAASNEFVEKS